MRLFIYFLQIFKWNDPLTPKCLDSCKSLCDQLIYCLAPMARRVTKFNEDQVADRKMKSKGIGLWKTSPKHS